jgi:hypothetical protein
MFVCSGSACDCRDEYYISLSLTLAVTERDCNFDLYFGRDCHFDTWDQQGPRRLRMHAPVVICIMCTRISDAWNN